MKSAPPQEVRFRRFGKCRRKGEAQMLPPLGIEQAPRPRAVSIPSTAGDALEAVDHLIGHSCCSRGGDNSKIVPQPDSWMLPQFPLPP